MIDNDSRLVYENVMRMMGDVEGNLRHQKRDG